VRILTKTLLLHQQYLPLRLFVLEIGTKHVTRRSEVGLYGPLCKAKSPGLARFLELCYHTEKMCSIDLPWLVDDEFQQRWSSKSPISLTSEYRLGM